MKRYLLDLTSLDMDKRLSTYDLIEKNAFIVKSILGDNGIECLDIFWDSPEDFPDSSIYPKGCPCRLITED